MSHRSAAPAGLAFLGVVLFAPVPLEAQMTEADPDRVVEKVDALHHGLDPVAALDLLHTALADRPRDRELLWRAARESIHLGMTTDDEREAGARYARSEEFARRLIAVDSADARGWSWLAITLGRRSEGVGGRERVGYAARVREAAERALALDPGDSGALHVLGAWHAEVMRLNGLTRFVAGKLPGGEVFADASWEEAERLLRRAVELAPEEIVHRVELARILLDRDRPGEAAAQLQTTLELEVLHPADPALLREAGALLERLSDEFSSGRR